MIFVVLRREAYSSLNAEGGFLAAFINANRDRIDERISICDLDPSYNTKRQIFLSHPPLWNCMKPYVMVLHFTGRTKPWHVRVPPPPRSKSKKGHSPSPPEEGRGEGGDIPLPSSAPLSSDPLFALWWAIYENRWASPSNAKTVVHQCTDVDTYCTIVYLMHPSNTRALYVPVVHPFHIYLMNTLALHVPIAYSCTICTQ